MTCVPAKYFALALLICCLIWRLFIYTPPTPSRTPPTPHPQQQKERNTNEPVPLMVRLNFIYGKQLYPAAPSARCAPRCQTVL